MALAALIAVPSVLYAQVGATASPSSSATFGYFSYDSLLTSMGGYKIIRHNVDAMKAQYAAEAKRSEDEFNDKYEAFLDDQPRLASTIRKKRQAELLDLMERNTRFKTEAKRLIDDYERRAVDSLSRILDAAIAEVGAARHLAFIVNTDNHNLPFVNPSMGEDVTAEIRKTLNVER